ncbi:MAG TPA: thioesterase domain-containing protein, partial [Clostridia bacterium]|nr:thioesterase domain-containing protein [Clostridia bacterium]
MVPSALVALDWFPLTPNGKLDRAALPEPAPEAAGGDAVAPRGEFEAEVLAVCQRALRGRVFGVTDDFFDLGVDSITAARLFTEIERTFHAQLPLGALFQAPSVAQLAALLRDHSGSVRDSWSALVPIRTEGDQRPFFGVHGGAGTTMLYYPLAHRLAPDRPLYGLQAVGLYGREAPQTTIPAMAARYLEEVKTVQPRGPYCIGGYCFGGLVAYEMAVQLRSRGENVELLAMFNAPAPGYNRRFNPVFDNEGALTDANGVLVRRVPLDRSLNASLARQVERTQGMGRRARAASIVGALQERLGGRIRFRVHSAQLAYALRFHRPLPDALREANTFQRIARRAQDAYDPPMLDVPIAVYRAEHLYHEPALGWNEYTANVVACVEVTGDQPVPRRTMREPFVHQVSDDLRSLLGDLNGPCATVSDGTTRAGRSS